MPNLKLTDNFPNWTVLDVAGRHPNSVIRLRTPTEPGQACKGDTWRFTFKDDWIPSCLGQHEFMSDDDVEIYLRKLIIQDWMEACLSSYRTLGSL